jgi:hypothetical protein
VQGADEVRPQDVRALESFREDYPEAEACLLYRGRERRKLGDVWCLPVEELLAWLRPDEGLLGPLTRGRTKR